MCTIHDGEPELARLSRLRKSQIKGLLVTPPTRAPCISDRRDRALRRIRRAEREPRQNENPARTGEERGSREPSLAPSGEARRAPASCLDPLAYTDLTAVGTRAPLSTGVLSVQQ